MPSQRPGIPTGALLLPLLSLAACGGAGGMGDATSGEGAGATSNPEPGAASVVASDLDGLTIRRVGVARFDVYRVDTYVDYGFDTGVDGTADIGFQSSEHTSVELAFTALDEPLDETTLARIAALPEAGASDECYPLAEAGTRSIGALIRSLGSPLLAGEVITVSNAAGSWFEVSGVDDEIDGPIYVVSNNQYSSFDFPHAFAGAEGTVVAGTTVDIPGSAFPAFHAVEVPPMTSLPKFVEGATGVTWQAGADPNVPMVIDLTFNDYVEIRPSAGGADDALTDSEYGVLTSENIHTLVEAPADMRCVTRDTGQFTYPDTLRTSIESFRKAGLAVAAQLAPGSDLSANSGADADDDEGITDADTVQIEQGTIVRMSRAATRYRVEGDALLIVQSGNHETL